MGKKDLTETEAELEARRDVVLVESAVVDEKIPGVVVAVRYGGAIVGGLFGDCVGQFSARRFRAVENIDETVTRFLACRVLGWCSL